MYKILICILLGTIGDPGMSILMKESAADFFDSDSQESATSNDTINWQCLQLKQEKMDFIEISENMFHCAKKNMYLGLLNNLEADCVDIGDGVTFTREGDVGLTPREVFPYGEPASFKGLVDAYSSFLSQRSARWDLGFLYPGLVLRIGPTMNGAGILEFGLERRLDYNERAKLGPGQVIVRRMILPHLLGFRMNLSSLLPIILGVILLIMKNAFVFSKVTMVLSVLLTLKSLFLLTVFRQPQSHSGFFQQISPVTNDPVELDDPLSITTVHRPRPQGYSVSEPLSDSVLSHMIGSVSPYRAAHYKSSQKRENPGKRNFSWE